MSYTVIFILVGLILIFSELLIPAFGFFALLGLGLVIAGTSLAYDPTLAEYGMAMILATSFALSLIIGGGGWFAWKAYRQKTDTGKEGLIGDKAEIIDWNERQGRVFIDGETWHARADKACDFEKGDSVIVEAVEDLTLIIKPKA